LILAVDESVGVAVGIQRVGAEGELVVVGEAVAIAVHPLAERILVLAVDDPVAIAVGIERVGAEGNLVVVGETIPVGVGGARRPRVGIGAVDAVL
jgi:hypothetical protein